MDLGLAGKSAIICASSKGLGKACAMSLAREGATVVINGRDPEALAATATDIRAATGADVAAVAGDVTTANGQAALFSACPEPDILINNAGGPAPGGFRDWDRQAWLDGMVPNMIAPVELMRACVDGMIERQFGRIVTVTSIAVKMPFEGLWMSTAARSGLTGFVAGLAREVAGHNVTVNNLMPGLFLTDRLRAGLQAPAERLGKTFEEMAAETTVRIPAGRFGDPAEFGEACAYLCSAQAGFITGQNILIDGGMYPGTF